MLQNIEAERVRVGLSKGELAKVLGVSTTSLSKYVREEWPIPSNILVEMARLFNCQVDYLLNLRPPTTPAA